MFPSVHKQMCSACLGTALGTSPVIGHRSLVPLPAPLLPCAEAQPPWAGWQRPFLRPHSHATTRKPICRSSIPCKTEFKQYLFNLKQALLAFS